MITQYQASALLKKEIPGLFSIPHPSRLSLEIYTDMNYFSDFTCHALADHNYPVAKKCFSLADRLYRFGDNVVRMLIANNFMYSVTSVIASHRKERLLIRSIIPARLYAISIRQATASGC